MTPDIAYDVERELTEIERDADELSRRLIDRDQRKAALAIRTKLHAARRLLARRVEEMQYAA